MVVRNYAVKDLLQHGVCDRPLMIHGASLETAIYFLRNGYLPKGIHDRKTISKDPTTDRVYFCPVTLTGEDRNHVLKEAKFHARKNGILHYVHSRLGIPLDAECKRKYYMTFRNFFLMNDPQLLLENLRSFAKLFNTSDEVAKEILKNAMGRYGVIFEANSNALRFLEGERAGAISLYCPDGLEYTCFDGILPLSETERKILLSEVK